MLLYRLFALRPITLNSFVLDDGDNGSQQIWTVDSATFPRNNNGGNFTEGNSSHLQPVYYLQQQAAGNGVRSHHQYETDDSFSPTKSNRTQYNNAAGSIPQSQNPKVPRKFKYNDGFRKSFSSDQLYFNAKPHLEAYSFSLSSRSSTTSAESSTKTAVWQKEIRSGIPIPILSETKLRLRTHHRNSNTAVGPVIARRSDLGSPVHSPNIPRPSPRITANNGSATRIVLPPSRSSDSESSGYFTPPPENNQAFVKLETEDRTSGSEDVIENDKNNNFQECNDSFVNNSRNAFSASDSVQRRSTPSLVETINIFEEAEKIENAKEERISIISGNSERGKTSLHSISTSSLREPSLNDRRSPNIIDRNKSKSVVELQKFLPDISSTRKNINSAPLLKENSVINNNLFITHFDEVPTSSTKIILPEAITPCTEIGGIDNCVQEGTLTRKLSRRLYRTQSRRSIKSTPRTVHDTTSATTAPIIKPKDNLQKALLQMNNVEWEVIIQGLQALSKIARSHPDVIEAQIHTVCVSLARHVKNLRSQVARTACRTSSDLFSYCKRGLDMELEEIVGPLLHRTADTNKFLRADANSALDIMCDQLPLHRVIGVITTRGCTHQNGVVRSAAMRLIAGLVKRFGAEKIFAIQKEMRDRIILAGANSLTDGSVEARSNGKAMLSYLIGHPQFNKVLLEAVPQSTIRHISKTLHSIKPYETT